MRRICSALTLLSVLFFSAQTSHADRGVFNANISPDEIFTNEQSTITITAEIGSGNIYISSIKAYQTTETGKPISQICQMYDDGTHGDISAADTVFSCQYTINRTSESKIYFMVTAAYQGDRNRYLSGALPLVIFNHLPAGIVEDAASSMRNYENAFLQLLAVMDEDAARDEVLQAALGDPRITAAFICGKDLCVIFNGRIEASAALRDPASITDAPGSSQPPLLPSNYKSPGNDKLLLFAPGYTGPGPSGDINDRQNRIADHAKDLFDKAAFIEFDPKPPQITKDEDASLGVVKKWGDYGTVVVHTHGNYTEVPDSWTNLWNIFGASKKVIIFTGTKANSENQGKYEKDFLAGRIRASSDTIGFYPSFIKKHVPSMKNTVLFLGACLSMKDESLWNALKDKGAKVAFGWSKSVCRPFNISGFQNLFDPMLPSDGTVPPLTARQAFDGISDKIDDEVDGCSEGAELLMKTASSEWDNFLFYEGGLINGDFETDWTGWTRGANPGNDYKIISSARKHGGQKAAALGRWDTTFHGSDPTAEPYGYEWIYQDFTVPHNVTYLKFYWWMETYDTAVWDWFDAYIKNTSGSTLKTILSNAGKPGTNYGPYWSTAMADGGSGWREVKTDISAYRGQIIRIYFDQHLDGYGDQQRVYIDDVTLE